jgi:hypothetical protein
MHRYLCTQKLIDVQQTLIAYPNPLKRSLSFIREKPINPISVNFLFLEFNILEKYSS